MKFCKKTLNIFIISQSFWPLATHFWRKKNVTPYQKTYIFSGIGDFFLLRIYFISLSSFCVSVCKDLRLDLGCALFLLVVCLCNKFMVKPDLIHDKWIEWCSYTAYQYVFFFNVPLKMINSLFMCIFLYFFFLSFTDIIPSASTDTETREFLSKVIDILLDYVKTQNDRNERILEFHHPEDMKKLLDLDLPETALPLQQLIQDCAKTLKYQVRTGK